MATDLTGDVLSLGMSADTRHLKKIREHEALNRFHEESGFSRLRLEKLFSGGSVVKKVFDVDVGSARAGSGGFAENFTAFNVQLNPLPVGRAA